MNSEIATVEESWMSPEQLEKRVDRIRQVHSDVMKENVHYGKVFDAAKPSLWQPGAQLLLLIFKVNNVPEVIDLSTDDEAKFRVITKINTQYTGIFLGTGVGECSSLEEKYMWRASVCDEEWESFPEDRRRIKFKKDYGKIYKIKQVRTNPADVSNTVLKMGNKRSLVNGTCTCLGASEVFTQDAGDLPPDMLGEEEHQQKQSTKPDITTETQELTPELREKNKWIAEGQVKHINILCKEHSVSLDRLHAWLKHGKGIEHLYQISWQGGQYKAICKAIEDHPDKINKFQAKTVKKEPEPPPPESEKGEDGPEKETGQPSPTLDTIRAYAKKSGCDTDEKINVVIKEQFNIEKIEDIKPEQYSIIIGLFDFRAEEMKNKT